jgi:hypothetical protein
VAVALVLATPATLSPPTKLLAESRRLDAAESRAGAEVEGLVDPADALWLAVSEEGEGAAAYLLLLTDPLLPFATADATAVATAVASHSSLDTSDTATLAVLLAAAHMLFLEGLGSSFSAPPSGAIAAVPRPLLALYSPQARTDLGVRHRVCRHTALASEPHSRNWIHLTSATHEETLRHSTAVTKPISWLYKFSIPILAILRAIFKTCQTKSKL